MNGGICHEGIESDGKCSCPAGYFGNDCSSRIGTTNLLKNPEFKAVDQEGKKVFPSWVNNEDCCQPGPQDSIVCRNHGGLACSFSQKVQLNQKTPRMLLITAHSAAEGVLGVEDYRYSVYMDFLYADGTEHWGIHQTFPVGSHDWMVLSFSVLLDSVRSCNSPFIHQNQFSSLISCSFLSEQELFLGGMSQYSRSMVASAFREILTANA